MISITKLKLPPHYENYLRGRGLATVESIKNYPRDSLLKAKNFGQKGMKLLDEGLKSIQAKNFCGCGNEIKENQDQCFSCFLEVEGPIF